MTEQGTLFKEVRGPYGLEFNPTAPEAAKPRLGRQQRAILERLRRGPATNTELSQIAQRFSARIGELRDAGYDIRRTHDDHERGVYVYELVERAR